MNPVALELQAGLAKWREIAKVVLLKTENVSVPRIFFSGKNDSDRAIIIASGLHLEETSGPLLLLDPERLLPILESTLKKGISFYVYPVINNYGLKFNPSSDEKFLRNNEKGINYNSGWGIDTSKKCLEVKLVEEDIKKIYEKRKIHLALSLHEDSTSRARGYLWTNAVNAKLRRSIQKKLTTKIDRKLLTSLREKKVQGGKVEMGFTIVGAKDKGTFEHWLGEDLKIPTLLSESPFGLRIEIRKNFHLAVIAVSLV